MSAFSYFPEMAGCEEETRLDLLSLVDTKRTQRVSLTALTHPAELDAIHSGINAFCPTLAGSKQFRVNGSRTYVDSEGIELATPEVDNPIDQLIYGKANVRLLERSLERYLVTKSRADDIPVQGHLQRRVIDTEVNTWGYHDNFSVQLPKYGRLIESEASDIGHLWLGFLYSRGYITGAMYTEKNLATFSQKLSVPYEAFNGYGYRNTILRDNTDHGQRLEIRCNDINLQDWAFLSRVGGAALLLAATQTRLGSELAKSPAYKFKEHENLSWNAMPLNKDLDLYPSNELKRSIDMQRYTLSTILNKLEDYTNEPIPPIYRDIGNSILQYSDDVEAVMEGKEDLETLTSRSDWALKLYVIRGYVRRDPAKRYLGDAKSRYIDLGYDRTTIKAEPDGSTTTTYGFGYTYTASDAIVAPDSDAVKKAMRIPPERTRAKVRVQEAQRLKNIVRACDWHSLTVVNETGGTSALPLAALPQAS